MEATKLTQILEQPIATAEFVALDTETNGLGGASCELTEIGAVLVGGGELHDRWVSLVRTNMPLGRGIQRFTGITQEQIDGAPEPEAVLPSLSLMLEGRVMVAHNAAFDRRVLRQAYDRVGLSWPDPPVLCTAALARALLPLQRERRLGRLADALGIEVEVAHRALADAETCGRILCALFPRLCASAATVADAVALVRPRRRPRAPRTPRRRAYAVGARELPQLDFAELPRDPGVYIFRDGAGKVLYVGKSVSIRSRARAHFAPATQRAAWTEAATEVDYRATASELGALITENRLIKQLRPPGNVRLAARDDERLVYIRCRLDIAFPILEVAPAPAPGLGVSIGPLRGRRWVAELVEQLDSLFGLRHCGRALPRREHPSAYGQMGRCLSPCLGDLDPNLYRRRLDEALRLFLAPDDARQRLGAHLDAQMRAAAAEQHYERAAALRRRRHRIEAILEHVEGALAASHARPRLVLAPHPTDASRFDALWLAGGRLVDFGELPEDPAERADRTARALARGGRVGEVGAHVPPDEIDELRIVGTYLASHPDLPQLALDPSRPPGRDALAAFVRAAQANGSSTTAASAVPADTRASSGTSRRTKPRAIGPSRGETAALATAPAGRPS
jgi:DNA polymerase-3 subunit epsilon